MIDNNPFDTEDLISIKNALSNQELIFVEDSERPDKKTGELYYYKKRKFKNLTLLFLFDSNDNPLKLTIRGSIHKYSNIILGFGNHNANQFSFQAFQMAYYSIQAELGINLSSCVLLPPEHGLNFKLDEIGPFKAEMIVDWSICEKRKVFQYNVPGKFTSKISGHSGTETRTKIYVKSIESPGHGSNILRIEEQMKKTRWLTTHGIKTVADLLCLENQVIIKEKYIECLKQLVIYDDTMKIPKNNRFKSKLQKMERTKYWRTLIDQCSKGELYREKYNREVKFLDSCSKKYGSNLKHRLIQYADNLYNKNLYTLDSKEELTVKKVTNAQDEKVMNAQLYIGGISDSEKEVIEDQYINKGLDIKQKEVSRKCLVTGLDISMQRDDSFLLSHTGLKYYYKTDKKIFEEIKHKHLTYKWADADWIIQIREIAHNIRDTVNGQRRKQEKLYPPHQEQLFEISNN